MGCCQAGGPIGTNTRYPRVRAIPTAVEEEQEDYREDAVEESDEQMTADLTAEPTSEEWISNNGYKKIHATPALLQESNGVPPDSSKKRNAEDVVDVDGVDAELMGTSCLSIIPPCDDDKLMIDGFDATYAFFNFQQSLLSHKWKLSLEDGRSCPLCPGVDMNLFWSRYQYSEDFLPFFFCRYDWNPPRPLFVTFYNWSPTSKGNLLTGPDRKRLIEAYPSIDTPLSAVLRRTRL
ncbi:uncharacterized protein BYT42DRAFT_550131 [Radiomyces spectabilis]|uniref:uncharacterized protein n=1 Tax=Radiomyces spectabilis TaxID=64574 RepID=UPI002220E43C|nr:uncharacterized protein BYT42DRAFT_550131 [Radiomyces spectabilis]KAI8365238.1 hypothetical protein BYT42DRAFT_550131 [Radiomyces spectabilis]